MLYRTVITTIRMMVVVVVLAVVVTTMTAAEDLKGALPKVLGPPNVRVTA